MHTTQNRENQSNQRNRGNQDNQENQATQENKKIHKKLCVVDWLVFLVVLGCLGFPETQETWTTQKTKKHTQTMKHKQTEKTPKKSLVSTPARGFKGNDIKLLLNNC